MLSGGLVKYSLKREHKRMKVKDQTHLFRSYTQVYMLLELIGKSTQALCATLEETLCRNA